jgi:hypothetical protein
MKLWTEETFGPVRGLEAPASPIAAAPARRPAGRLAARGKQAPCGGASPPGRTRPLHPAPCTLHPAPPQVMIVIPFSTDEEAIRIANDCPFGLGSNVFCASQVCGAPGWHPPTPHPALLMCSGGGAAWSRGPAAPTHEALAAAAAAPGSTEGRPHAAPAGRRQRHQLDRCPPLPGCAPRGEGGAAGPRGKPHKGRRQPGGACCCCCCCCCSCLRALSAAAAAAGARAAHRIAAGGRHVVHQRLCHHLHLSEPALWRRQGLGLWSLCWWVCLPGAACAGRRALPLLGRWPLRCCPPCSPCPP